MNKSIKTRILITEEKITKPGQIKVFEIRLPKNTKRVKAVAVDLRMVTNMEPGKPTGEEGFFEGGSDGMSDGGGRLPTRGEGRSDAAIWDLLRNRLVGNLLLQSLEKANIFFSGQLWLLKYDDGISNLRLDSLETFPVFKKTTPKKVEVPCETTVIKCLYKDKIGINEARYFTYYVKVLLWIECEEENKAGKTDKLSK